MPSRSATIFLLTALLSGIPSCSLSPGPRYPKYDGPSQIDTVASEDPKPYTIVRRQAPDLPTYDELVALSLDPEPKTPALRKKLSSLFNTAFVENSSRRAPAFRAHPTLGPRLNIASWNVGQSRCVPQLRDAIRRKSIPTSDAEAQRQYELIRDADVIVLQEMDIGHQRSGFLHTPRALSRAWGMNYAYGVQYLEVDPAYLGTDDSHLANRDTLPASTAVAKEDRHRYHGLFGNAVLSRFPIKRAEVISLDGPNYDWYRSEAQSFDILEGTRRFASNTLFHQNPDRELKIGSRSFLKIDLHVPGLPKETLTVINVHLEVKFSVKKRHQQLKAILAQIKDIDNPVVLAGDFNSTLFNVGPTSIARAAKRAITTPNGIANLVIGLSEVTQLTRLKDPLNFAKNYTDPLAAHIPFVLGNSQQATFRTIRDFRFGDGGAFDFRGCADRSTGRHGALGNSNQRDDRGFVATFKVNRPIGPIGYEKLDWIFVKSFLRSPNDTRGSRALAPHFGETLSAFNRSGHEPFSDHDPIIVTLPLEGEK